MIFLFALEDMNFLTLLLTLLYVAAIETKKNLYRLHPGAEVLEDKRGIDDGQDLVGLVLLDNNNQLIRRYSKSHSNIAEDMKIWSRRSRKHNSNRRESKHIKEKITGAKMGDDKIAVAKDFGDRVVDKMKSKKSKDNITETRIGGDISGSNDDFEEIVAGQIKPIGRKRYDNDCDCEQQSKKTCLTETEKTVEKCKRACNRAHEDVCDRLRCSSKAMRGLTKECEFYCKKVFNPKTCYRRFG